MPVYNIEISHPDNNFIITPVVDKIITLEDTNASLPYGSSSGSWGMSGKMFTERAGTPIGADIVYFSRYEDTFYHLKANFPVERVKELARRAYANSDDESCYKGKEYVDVLEEEAKCNNYRKMSDLVFGFAPKGVVVVWLRFGIQQIEIGQFQAEVIKDDKEYEEKLFSTISQTREDIYNKRFLADASPDLWLSYRQKYTWEPIATSTHKDFHFLGFITNKYYNGKREKVLFSWLKGSNMRERAVPRELTFYFTTSKGEQFEGRVFFDFDQMSEAFKKAGPNAKIEFKIASDNSDYEIFLNGEPLEVKSKRLFKNDMIFKDSYK
ncbi:DUF2931 family protein [Empedobacter sp. UBA7248]|uniref:DUF2931 family protein n=1 Tax=Empedobacter sp. UBA7248 TaxID=1946448 RepID=UPI0025C1BD5F|nr:DUF2931 family protein [Empedobacter sp. UBA7248]